MSLFEISMLIFCSITAILAYLIGRMSSTKKLNRIGGEVDNLRQSLDSRTEANKELEHQLMEQSKTLSSLIDNKKKIKDQLSQLDSQKEEIRKRNENLEKRIEDLFKNTESLDDILTDLKRADGEALRWRNEYVKLNNYQTEGLQNISQKVKKLKIHVTKLLTEKYDLVQMLENEHTYQFMEGENSLLAPVTNNAELSRLELEVKRKENVIKTLRSQLQALNLQKLETKRTELSLEENTNADIDTAEELSKIDEENFKEEFLLENDYSEVLDEANEGYSKGFEENEFIEEKIRKTGYETLNYSNVKKKTEGLENEIVPKGQPKLKGDEKETNFSTYLDSLKSQRMDPSRLTLVFNIDSELQFGLFDLGIKNFRQLAEIEDRFILELETTLGIKEGRIVNEKWREQAEMLSDEENIRGLFVQTRSKSVAEELGQKDFDLTLVKGIGRTFSEKLTKAGIKDLRDLAKWNEQNIDELALLISVSSSRIVKQDWIKQARSLLQQTSVD